MQKWCDVDAEEIAYGKDRQHTDATDPQAATRALSASVLNITAAAPSFPLRLRTFLSLDAA